MKLKETLEMEKHFATYNQSLALKELGFDEPCIATYTEGAIGKGNELQWFISPLEGVNKDFTFVAAPIKSQVFEWFRDKHKLCGFALDIDKINCYYYGISELFSGETIEDTSEGPYNNTFEESESACIDKLIEIVKKH